MNINLLPEKFIKNKALEFIIVMLIASIIIFTVLYSIIFIFFNSRSNQVVMQQQVAKIEGIKLKKNIDNLEKSQFLELQSHIQILKDEQTLAAPIMDYFERKMDELNLKIINYRIVMLGDSEKISSNVKVGADGTQLLETILFRVQGKTSFHNISMVKPELEKIEWIYDVQPIKMTNEVDKIISEFEVRVVK